MNMLYIYVGVKDSLVLDTPVWPIQLQFYQAYVNLLTQHSTH
jgi:hypothetical protein